MWSFIYGLSISTLVAHCNKLTNFKNLRQYLRYQHSSVLFDARKWLKFTAIKPLLFDLPLRCWKLHSRATKFQNFPGEHAPDPPRYSAFGEGLSLGELFLLNSLSLYSTGSRVLEFLSVRRIFVVPKDRIWEREILRQRSWVFLTPERVKIWGVSFFIIR